MAAPNYTQDLIDIDLSESGSTGWIAFNISGGGGGAPAFGADLGMQGSGCWDKAASNAERGLAVNKTPGTGTVAAGVHIYQWGFVATPGICDTYANRGVYVIIGTSTSDFMQYTVEGSDTIGAGGRVGRCYPIRYLTTANTGSVPYRTVNGSPGATPTYFGYGIKTIASAKGSNIGADAVRYGTGAFLTAGELISAGDGSDDPCTFTGFSIQNDAVANRWGILSLINGSFELQGIFAIGQNNSGTATLARFRESDKNIVVIDTVHSTSTFSQFIIDHASTRCEWNNISITALGTNNRGSLSVMNAATIFLATGGVWTGMSTIDLEAASVLTAVTLRSTDLITLNGAELADCSIENNRNAVSVLASTLDNITGCTFTSDGSNHAVELDSIGGGSMTWDNKLSGYVAGVAGSPASTSSTGNEAIYVNVGSGTLTINVASGADVPSIRTAGATVNVVAGSVTYTLTVQDTSGAAIENARVFMAASSGGPFFYQTPVTIIRTGTTATVSHTAHGMNNGDKVVIRGVNEREYYGIHTVSNVFTNSYDFTVSGSPATPATGTITSTYVFISALTDVNGQVSGSKTFSTNQPLQGNVRKSSAAPYYKTGVIVGAINKDTGLDSTITLLSDE